MNDTCRFSTRCLLFCPHNQKNMTHLSLNEHLLNLKLLQLGCDTSGRSAGSHQHASVVITNLRGEARVMAGGAPGQQHVLNQAILKVAQQKQCW